MHGFTFVGTVHRTNVCALPQQTDSTLAERDWSFSTTTGIARMRMSVSAGSPNGILKTVWIIIYMEIEQCESNDTHLDRIGHASLSQTRTTNPCMRQPWNAVAPQRSVSLLQPGGSESTLVSNCRKLVQEQANMGQNRTYRWEVSPVPNWPLELSPHEYTFPPIVRARQCDSPQAIAITGRCSNGLTRTGMQLLDICPFPSCPFLRNMSIL